MVIHIFFLVLALCLDIFVAGVAYGAHQIKLSLLQTVVINTVCSLCLGISLLFGNFLDHWIPESLTREVCFFSLLSFGCLKLADASIRQYIKNHREVHKNISFTFSQLHFILNIYSNPTEADADYNHNLSWKELIFFSAAMSIDSLIVGTMAAFLKISVPVTVLCAFLTGEVFTFLGLFLGRKIKNRFPQDLSWISGVLFVILAVLKK